MRLSYSIGIILLLIGVASAASGPVGNGTCRSGDIGTYAHYSFCLPPDVSVLPDAGSEGVYSNGREAWTSFKMNGSTAQIHLIYPCSGVAPSQGTAVIRAVLEDFSPSMRGSAVYFDTPLTIDGRPGIWGAWEYLGVGQFFASYQPGSNCIAAIFMNAGIPVEVRTALLQTIRISVNEAASPLRPGDCKPAVDKVVYYYWDNHTYDDWPDNNTPFYPEHVARMKRFDDIGRWMAEESEAIRERVIERTGGIGPYTFDIPVPFTPPGFGDMTAPAAPAPATPDLGDD